MIIISFISKILFLLIFYLYHCLYLLLYKWSMTWLLFFHVNLNDKKFNSCCWVLLCEYQNFLITAWIELNLIVLRGILMVLAKQRMTTSELGIIVIFNISSSSYNSNIIVWVILFYSKCSVDYSLRFYFLPMLNIPMLEEIQLADLLHSVEVDLSEALG